MDKEKVLGTIKSATRSFADRLNNQYAENLDDEFYQGFDLCMMKMMNLLVDSNLKDAEIMRCMYIRVLVEKQYENLQSNRKQNNLH